MGVVARGEPAAFPTHPEPALRASGHSAWGAGSRGCPRLELPREVLVEVVLLLPLAPLEAVQGKSSFACLCKEALSATCKVQTFYRSLKII